MATKNTSNSIPLNCSINYLVTAQDASDGNVKFDFGNSWKLAANAQVVDVNNASLATTGMLIDDTVNGEVTIGNAPAIAEVITLTIEGTVATTGTADVDIRGAGDVNIVTTDGDTASEVATSIAAGTFSGWTMVAVDNVVTFTAATAGAKTGVNAFALTTSTGITGTFATPQLGYDAGAFSLTEGTTIKLIANRDNSQFDEA